MTDGCWAVCSMGFLPRARMPAANDIVRAGSRDSGPDRSLSHFERSFNYCARVRTTAAPMSPMPPDTLGQRRPAHRHPEERRGRLPPARLSRRQRRRDRQRAGDDQGQPLLLLPQQGRDPLCLPRLLARRAAGAARGRAGRDRRPPTRSCASWCWRSCTSSSTSCRAPRSRSICRRSRRRCCARSSRARDVFDRGLRAIIQHGMDQGLSRRAIRRWSPLP